MFILIPFILSNIGVICYAQGGRIQDDYNNQYVTLEKSEKTMLNETIIMFSVIFFIVWILLPMLESSLKTLKELNDSYHFNPHQEEYHNELTELKEQLKDTIILNRHRYKEFVDFNENYHKELTMILEKISSLEDKFSNLAEEVFDVNMFLDKLRPEVATCKGGYEVVS